MRTIDLLKYFTVFCFIPVLSACQQKGLANYARPESTVKTYLEQAQTLRVVADHRFFRRALHAFVPAERKWFRKNFEKLPFEKEEYLYNRLYKTKKMAYVFGRSIVPAGPDPDSEEITVEKQDDSSAKVRVAGYPEDINLIKQKDKWYIVKLFRPAASQPE